MQLWLVDIDGQHDREIVNLGADAKVRGVWCPDGRHILIHADAPTHFRVGLWSLDTGDLRWLIDDPTRNIEEIAFPPASDQAILLESHFARYHARLLDVQTGTETTWPDTAGRTSLPVAPVPEGGWVVCQYSSTQLKDLVYHTDDGTSSSISRVWDQTSLHADDLIAAEDMRWHGDDGLEIQGWLYRARGEARGTIIYVHGGPTWHYEDWVDSESQFLAWCGFNVLAPNYRGSTGFGKIYREAIKKEGWGAEEQADIRAGIEALIRTGIAHPGRIGITGTSYGGYSSWCAITRQPVDLVAAAAPVCGMTDLVIDYKTTRPDLRPYSAEMLGGTPDEVPERYHERSPVHYVGAIRGRLLIVQGEQDPNVTPENVRVVQDRLDASGIAYEVLTFPDEGHGIVRRENRKTLLIRLNAFFTEAFERVY
jgi:dipeptidyl aminopeptidase/acylaminoacyl peptidase